jgi:hypothetical protein
MFLDFASSILVGSNTSGARFVQPHALGFFNLRHLRIMHDDLHNPEPQ